MDPTTLVGSAGLAPPPPASNAFGQLSSEDFVKIIFTELSKQDPLKPNDSSALLEQMSNLRSIQSDMELSRKLESMVRQNQLAASGNLLGRLISGVTEQRERVEGLVVSVSSTSSGPMLNLHNGFRVPFDNIDEMLDPSLFQPAPAGGSN